MPIMSAERTFKSSQITAPAHKGNGNRPGMIHNFAWMNGRDAAFSTRNRPERFQLNPPAPREWPEVSRRQLAKLRTPHCFGFSARVKVFEQHEVTAMPVLLVIGASRGVGLETVKRALGDGHRVRALARSAASIAVDQPELKKIQGDALDTATVTSAVAGVDAVIHALGATKGPQALFSGTTLFSKATRILIDAMRALHVKRLLAVTGLGAGDS